MQDCAECGTGAIAEGLAVCPHCGKELEMPKITVGGGPSHASAVPGEPGYIPPPEPEPVPAPAPAPKTAKAAKAAKPDG